jgi:DNA-binding NtrC family response regulator
MISHTTAARVQDVPPVRVVGSSEAMRRVVRAALFAARGNTNVLISGERGVGKAAIARFIHEHSHRGRNGYRTINCKGLPDLLVESKLFGHIQGSFAGAYSDSPGLLESVLGGTVFLDDVDGLSPRMQTRLLRFLETGEYQRIGGDRVHTELHVRVIASTTADLSALAAAGLFLEDLYRQLNVVRLPVPPLREHRDDIPSLVDHFAGQLAGRCACMQCGVPDISNAIRIALSRADWPGNVRELRSVVLRHLISEVCPRRAFLRPTLPPSALVH